VGIGSAAGFKGVPTRSTCSIVMYHVQSARAS
jgi:hypothetical protein